jgi:hypothetical protein
MVGDAARRVFSILSLNIVGFCLKIQTFSSVLGRGGQGAFFAPGWTFPSVFGTTGAGGIFARGYRHYSLFLGPGGTGRHFCPRMQALPPVLGEGWGGICPPCPPSGSATVYIYTVAEPGFPGWGGKNGRDWSGGVGVAGLPRPLHPAICC